MSSGADRMVSSAVVATGSAMDIKIVGFKPRRVEIWQDQGITLTWTDAMPDAYGLLRIANGTGSLLSSTGITPLANGFTLGASAANVAGRTTYWAAFD